MARPSTDIADVCSGGPRPTPANAVGPFCGRPFSARWAGPLLSSLRSSAGPKKRPSPACVHPLAPKGPPICGALFRSPGGRPSPLADDVFYRCFAAPPSEILTFSAPRPKRGNRRRRLRSFCDAFPRPFPPQNSLCLPLFVSLRSRRDRFFRLLFACFFENKG